MNRLHEGPGSWRRRRFAALMVPMALLFGLAACDLDDLLDVPDPEVADPGSVRDPSALPVVFAGAVRDFTWAYSGTATIVGGGDNESIILISALLTDEQQHFDTFGTRREVDRRAIPTTAENATTDNGVLSDPYHNLHRARRAAEVGEDLFAAGEAGDTRNRSILSSLAGFTYVLFGEVFCEGVPYSGIALDGTVTHGTPTTRAETFGLARERFQRAIAIAQAAGSSDAEYLARVGMARAYLNEGNFSAAVTEAATVPDDFVFLLEHSDNTTGEGNGVWAYTHDTGRYGVSEVPQGLDWASDPRTPVAVNPRAPFDASIDYYNAQNKYSARTSPAVLADGREARLIRAEAALQNGDDTDFLAHLNAARALDDLDALTAVPGTDAGKVDLLFAERGFAMWLTAHRLGDLRRLVRQYGRDQADVFPSGTYWREGLLYGSDVNFPIYVDENNNPNFTGCLNRDA